MKVVETLELIRWLILDVDGTMTDGGIYLDGNGVEIKKFTVQDGAGRPSCKGGRHRACHPDRQGERLRVEACRGTGDPLCFPECKK